jgi:GNAT superfamily N-acetyltransferase
MITKKQITLHIQKELMQRFLHSYYGLSADHQQLDPHRFETLRLVNAEYEVIMSYVPGSYQVGAVTQGLYLFNDSIRPQINDPEFVEQKAAVLRYKAKVRCALYSFWKKNGKSIVIMLHTPVLGENNAATIELFYLTLNLLQQFAASLPVTIKKLHILQMPYTTVTSALFQTAGFHLEYIATVKKMNVWIERDNLNSLHCQNTVATVEILDAASYASILPDIGCVNEHATAAKLSQEQFGVFVQDVVTKKYMGGVVCEIEQSSLHIDMLWLDQKLRGKGLAKPILHQAELYAKKLQCTDSYLDTASYEAPRLYSAVGYQVYSEVPVGPHRNYFYHKKL